MRFSDIVGHESIKTHLKGAIANNRISHAYIFNGEDDCGKRTMAEIFAAAVQCQAEDKNVPCGVCKSCLQAASGNHPDIIRVTHEKSVISVDDIRTQLNSDVQIKPYSSRYKIYIIDEAEKMNEQAQNALLKTIEEPPEYAVIMLLTNNAGRFLQTILSRCVRLEFRSIENSLVKKYLMEKCQVPDYQAELSAAFSSGNIGKAKKYAATEDFSRRLDELVRLMRSIDDMSTEELTGAVKYFAANKAQIDEYIGLIELWFRDILVYKASGDSGLLLYRNEQTAIQRQAERRQFGDFEGMQKAFEKLRTRLKVNVNFEVSMQIFLLEFRCS